MTCICNKIDNYAFDLILKDEFKLGLGFDEIVKKSLYLVVDKSHIDDDLKLLSDNEILSHFRGKEGIYHIWISTDYCVDHDDKQKLLCIYVGKGQVQFRMKDHIKNKLHETNEQYMVGFFECKNRIAKYLEQLFLDMYKFHLNKSENSGTDRLYTMLDSHICLVGTEEYHHLEILEKKHPDIFTPQ